MLPVNFPNEVLARYLTTGGINRADRRHPPVAPAALLTRRKDAKEQLPRGVRRGRDGILRRSAK